MSAAARLPAEIFNAIDYERLAVDYLDPAHHAYIAGGCSWGQTVDANRRAFARWHILPRVLRDLRQGHSRLQLAGLDQPHPFLLAPVAHQRLMHEEAETAAARAAVATATCMIASTLSSTSLEEIAAYQPRRWFQLYLQPRREDTLDLLGRAEAAGYEAIVLTADASIQLASRQALKAGFVMPEHCVPVNLQGYAPPAAPTLADDDSRIFQGALAHAARWEELHSLQNATALPLWVKGVLAAEDARALQQAGVAGLVVSNHGGRSLDGSPASLDLLPSVRTAVGPDFPLLFDGGIRSGSDAFKALALGANAVLIGRLQAYALAVGGALGVAHMLNLLIEELHACMALAGCASLAEINSRALLPAPPQATEVS